MSNTHANVPNRFLKSSCLLGYEWLIRGVSSTARGGLTDEVQARIRTECDQARSLQVVSRVIPLTWTDDHSIDVRFIDHENRLRDAWRRYADFMFNEHRIHVETFGGQGGGPGFAFEEVRIYVDEEIRGRTLRLGCSLGGGSMGDRAVALLREDLALTIGIPADVMLLVRAKEV